MENKFNEYNNNFDNNSDNRIQESSLHYSEGTGSNVQRVYTTGNYDATQVETQAQQDSQEKSSQTADLSHNSIPGYTQNQMHDGAQSSTEPFGYTGMQKPTEHSTDFIVQENRELSSGAEQENYNNQSHTQNPANAQYTQQQVSNEETGYGQYKAQDNTDRKPNFDAQSASTNKAKKKASGMKKQHGFGMTMIKCAAIAVVFGLVSSTVFYGTGLAFEYTIGRTPMSVGSSTNGNKDKVTVNNGNLSATNVSTATTVTDVSDIVENVMPSIVSITNMGQAIESSDFFGRTFVQEVPPSAGSGIVIGQTEEEIYVATNNHVVSNSEKLTVNFVDDQQVTAEIKGTDPSTDLAVLAVKVKDIPSETMSNIKVATLGNSDDVKVGQSVVAIGNALGYGQAVTTGVVSALDREVTLQDETTGETITNDLLQTDAAINPGNSGGALLNMNGEVIGINSAKYTDTQVEGMGYAIPISAAEPIINDLITREVVDESQSSFLGVSGQDVTSEIGESFGMPEGLYITRVVENSAAEQAGIKKGDVLTELDGRVVKSMEGLEDIMQYYAAGTEVEVTLQVNQNGEWVEQKTTVTLGRKNN